MRGSSRRADAVLAISVRAFAWDAARIATLRHSTLPWAETFGETVEIAAKRLADAKDVGARDRLSLVAQFAAHAALLQFAGIADGEFDANEWAIASKRGSDARLVRIAARACNASDAPPVLTTIEQFAEAVGAPRLETFRRSWARAESVYAEVFGRVSSDISANSTWLRASAFGEILPPGADVLEEIAGGAIRDAEWDRHVADALRAMAVVDARIQAMSVCGGSVLQRFSALSDLRRIVRNLEELSESEIVEKLVPAAASRRIVMAVDDVARLDAASARVVQLASTIEPITVIRLADRPADRTWFVVSTRLASRRALEERLRACTDPDAALRAFVASDAFAAYLSNGDVPAIGATQIDLAEPRRSYVAALALLGTEVPLPVARGYLDQLLFAGDLTELAVPGIATVDDDDYRFASNEVRARITNLIAPAEHASLYRVAAGAAEKSGRFDEAARLLLGAGDAAAAVEMFAKSEWSSAEELVHDLAAVPSAALSSELAERFASALIDCGRYDDARAIAGRLADRARELTLARIERQTGQYDSALQRLIPLAGVCAADLIRAEILSVQRKTSDARDVLDSCTPASDDERVRIAYERALLGIEPSAELSGYYAARLATYRAMEQPDIEAALDAVDQSLAAATTVIHRLDALLDRMYVLFSAGRWSEARAAALEGLTLAEETQGDRAAGGFLFVIAYLAADDGQWAHASQRVERLRRFYSGMHDDRHSDELALLSAHLDFSRGHFAEAEREAAALVDSRHDSQIREAAALIVDEAGWIRGGIEPLRSNGKTENVELTDRHRLMLMRRGHGAQTFSSPFIAALAKWESGGAIPAASSTTQKLMMFRSAAGRKDHAAAERLARETGIELTRASESPREDHAVLRALTNSEFPFDERPLAGAGWRYATRNRLRQWQQIGSLAPLTQEELECEHPDCVVISDRELLFIDGISRWSAESRDATVALFRAKAEVHRLRRIVDQEEAAPAPERDAISGIVGESAAVRDLLALVTRVAKRDVPICVLGESGTGKELIARAIHTQSARRHRPFTAINCAALPENLIESELFGHVRGAFTGADRDRAGVIESTDGGTLFLDEIGEMPLVAQAKLLRFLQDGEFRRVGDASNRSADVRIVAATNRKLEAAVEEGRFREDLYYRIRGLEATLPPLRERGRDVLLLANHFIAAERAKHRSGPSRLSAEAEAIFLAYNWPGNVRELQNTIRAAHAIAGDAREIDVDHLPERLRRIVAPRTTVGSYQEAVARFRRDLIEKSLAEAMGNQNRAATMLNISRQALAYQIRELGIMVNKPRDSAMTKRH